MKKKTTTTHGDYSPGIVHGDYNIHLSISLPCDFAQSQYVGNAASLNEGATVFVAPDDVLWATQLAPSEKLRTEMKEKWLRLRAGDSASPTEVLKFVELVFPSTVTQGNWELRRALSLVAARAIQTSPNDPAIKHLVNRLSEGAIHDPDRGIFLASALARAPGTATSYRRLLIDLITNSSHSQVSWQIFKACESLPILLSTNTADLMVDKAASQWHRQRLLISAVVSRVSSRTPFASKVVENIIAELLRKELVENGDSFLIPFATWQAERFGSEVVSTSIKSSILPRGIFVVRNAIAAPLIPTCYRDVPMLAWTYDAACMDFELPSVRNSRTGQGHYAVVVAWINELINRIDPIFLSDAIDQILSCNDEGVRWALARVLRERRAMPEHLHKETLKKLILDQNTWVAREAIESLSACGASLGNIDLYAITAIRRIHDLQLLGSPEAVELLKPFLGLVQTSPQITKFFSIVPSTEVEKMNEQKINAQQFNPADRE